MKTANAKTAGTNSPGMKSVTARQIVHFIWSYFRRFPWLVFGAYFFITLSFTSDLTHPLILSQIVSAIQNESLTMDIRLQQAIFWVVLIGIQGIIFHVSARLAHFINCHTDSRVESLIATETLDRVQKFSSDWHNNSFAGSVVTKIKRGTRAAHNFFDIVTYDLYPALGVVIGLVVTTSLKNSLLGIIFGIFAVIFITMSVTLALGYVAPQRRKATIEDNKIGATLADAVSCNATVKSFGAEKRELNFFQNVVTQWRHVARKAWIRSNIVAVTQNVLIMIFKAATFGAAVWLWYTGALTVADFVFVLASYLLFTGYFRPIGDRIRDLQEAMSDIEDTVIFHHTPIEVLDSPDAKNLKIIGGKIEIKNITFNYRGNAADIYKNFNLTINPGEKIALVGHSGSGKSTLVKLIQRLYNLRKGSIEIDGQDISKITQSSLRKNIALVPQDPLLFHRTLQQNIAYGKTNATPQEIDRAAKLAHAYEFIKNLPQKYDTLVGERGVKLSGGERQRVAIARAMLADAPILILDEATSSLDSHSESLIQDALKNLLKNRTSIIIAHRLSTIKTADRILVFEHGKIVEEGNHQTLVHKEGGVYKKLYEMQVGGFLNDDAEKGVRPADKPGVSSEEIERTEVGGNEGERELMDETPKEGI